MPGNVRRSTRIKINRENQAADELGTSKRAHETDPEDDYDEKPQKKRVKSGATKKKKQQSTIVAPAKPRKRRGASLSMMVEQPIDIILTICQFIATPRDFVSLMQVSHAFFNLLSSHAIGKWTDLRAEFKTPDPLPGMSEVEWAMLLLGEPRLGYERVSNWYYSREEVEKVLKDLKRLRSKPYAATSAYLLSGRKSRDEKNNLYQHAWDWICDYKGREDDEVCGVRSNAIQQRLIELGYRETHVEIISASVTFRKPKVVNDREWENIKEKVLDEMKDHRVQLVLQDPFVADFTTRSGLMRAAHTQFKKSLAPGTWINQPPIERISKFSRVLELLIAPDDVVWTTQDFVDAIESHRSDIEQWGVSVTISSGVSHTGINYLAQRSLGQDFTGEYPKMHDNAYYSPNHAEDCNQLAVYQFQCGVQS
ncbi:hypothetical protein VNI00_012280 [Paramarasmius palmivorus]|uniref:F-box domain-containing protein n=1 Tax=Paramarasmius palmivorus TaxID=297713 RepID=A0AAW0C5T9_9AGAR